jgi:hypothetical protein
VKRTWSHLWHCVSHKHYVCEKVGMGLFEVCVPHWFVFQWPHIFWQQEGTPYWEEVPYACMEEAFAATTAQEVATIINDFTEKPKCLKKNE